MSSIQNSLVTNFVNMEKHHISDVLIIEQDSYGYPWSEKIFYDCINNNYFCKVLLLDNSLIGYLISSIVQNECHIMNLCVKKEYRNFGYGKLILNELYDELIKLNCEVIFLECRPSNKQALKLYSTLGYNEIGKRRNYYPAPNGYEDAVILAKNVKK